MLVKPFPLTIIHGDDAVRRQAAVDAKLAHFAAKGLGEVKRIDAPELDLTQFVQATQPTTLFKERQVFLINRYFSLKNKALQRDLSAYLNQLPAPVILTAAAVLTPSQLKPFPSAVKQVYQLPKLVFTFLDSLFPGNQADFIPLFEKIILSQPPETLLVMIASRVRQLLQLADGQLKLAPWQLARLAVQKNHFPDDRLLALHHSLVQLDRSAKSGRLVGSLASELASLLVKI